MVPPTCIKKMYKCLVVQVHKYFIFVCNASIRTGLTKYESNNNNNTQMVTITLGLKASSPED